MYMQEVNKKFLPPLDDRRKFIITANISICIY